jgi:hypothetical protein
MKINKIIADKASEKWAELLRNPKYKMTYEGSTQSEKLTQAFTNMMVPQLPSNLTEDKLIVFQNKLSKLIRKCDDNYMHLSVDYHPDKLLSEAAAEADIEMEWPCKTTMWLYKDKIELRAGYGSPIKTIFEINGSKND